MSIEIYDFMGRGNGKRHRTFLQRLLGIYHCDYCSPRKPVK